MTSIQCAPETGTLPVPPYPIKKAAQRTAECDSNALHEHSCAIAPGWIGNAPHLADRRTERPGNKRVFHRESISVSHSEKRQEIMMLRDGMAPPRSETGSNTELRLQQFQSLTRSQKTCVLQFVLQTPGASRRHQQLAATGNVFQDKPLRANVPASKLHEADVRQANRSVFRAPACRSHCHR